MPQASWHLDRRTFLRGAGLALALPWLEAMAPASPPAQRPKRFCAFFFGNGRVTARLVAEFVAGNRGLGALLVVSMGTFSTPLLYATMLVLTALAFTVYWLASWLEQKALSRYNLGAPRA